MPGYCGWRAPQAGLTWLQAREAVHWVSPAAVVRPLNLHAVRIAQSGDGGDGGGGVPGTGAAPLWTAGLHGQGQIVGMGDSGVDVDSCFFHHEGVVPGEHSARCSRGMCSWFALKGEHLN